MNQSQALKILKSKQNIFLTGSAGTGKTFLLNKFIEYLKKEKIRVSVTASTGIAATHLGGRTIHSWSGMGIEKKMNDKQIRKLLRREKTRVRIRDTEVLIIDEISMLDAERLDLLNKICQVARGPFLPFGGLQIIMCGDFFQLPPVEQEGREIKFAYDSWAWQEAEIKICYLDRQYRQNDFEFVDILNRIRENKASENVLNKLKTRLFKEINSSIEPTKLYTHNADVDEINDFELARIREKKMIYRMDSKGPEKIITFLKKNCLAPEELNLKLGAVVMFVKNNFRDGYVNGTLGKVINFDKNNLPIIETKSGDKITATPVSWELEENREVVAEIRQIPLRLAWAITVHKSQGMSLDAAEIDLSKSFERGMGYVALSIVRRLDGIKLLGINQMALEVNQEVVKKDEEFRELSEEVL